MKRFGLDIGTDRIGWFRSSGRTRTLVAAVRNGMAATWCSETRSKRPPSFELEP
jgi:hypothetical protein